MPGPRQLAAVARSSLWLLAAFAFTVLAHELAHALAAWSLGATELRISYGFTYFEPAAGWSRAHLAIVLLAGPALTLLQLVVALLVGRARATPAPGAPWIAWLATVAAAHLGTTLVLVPLGSDVGRAVGLAPWAAVTSPALAIAGGVLLAALAPPLRDLHEAHAAQLPTQRGQLARLLLVVAVPWLTVGVAVQLLLFEHPHPLGHALMSVLPLGIVLLGTGAKQRMGNGVRGVPTAARGRLRAVMTALAALLVAAFAWRLLTIVFRLAAGDVSNLPLVSAFINAIAALAALLIAGIVRGMTPSELGLARHRLIRRLAFGALLAVAASGVVLGVLAAAGWLHSHGRWSTPTYQPLGSVLAFFLLAGAYEELLFRGVLLGLGRHVAGAWPAIVVSAGAFAWAHALNVSASTRSIVTTLLAGIVLACLFLLTESVWAPIAFHFTWNATLGVVAGLPVSGIDVGAGLLGLAASGPAAFTGDAYGPEGGYVALVTLALLALALALALRVRTRSPAGRSPAPDAPR